MTISQIIDLPHPLSVNAMANTINRKLDMDGYQEVGLRVRQKRKVQTKNCITCHAEYQTVWGGRQKYCDACKVLPRIGERVLSPELRSELKQNAKPAWMKKIALQDGSNTTSIADVFDRPKYVWMVRYRIPFSLDVSKNRRTSLAMRRHKPFYISNNIQNYHQLIVTETKAALGNRKVVHNKLWISFYVEKQNHKFDAINVIDTLADAIKVAVGLDDNWFCIDRVNWSVVKHDPQIIIQIAQDSEENVQVCSHCGEIKPLDDFSKHKGAPFDRGRACKKCRSIIRAEERVVRRKIKEQFAK